MGPVRFELTTYGSLLIPINYYKTAALTRLSYEPILHIYIPKTFNKI